MEARRGFDEMMGENSFVKFWGRLGKIGGACVDSSIQNDDVGEEEGEGGERVDIVKVLKVRSRARSGFQSYANSPSPGTTYGIFNHVPEQRDGSG